MREEGRTMILEAIYSRDLYSGKTVVPKPEKYRNALQASMKSMDRLAEKRSKEDYNLVEEFQDQASARIGGDFQTL